MRTPRGRTAWMLALGAMLLGVGLWRGLQEPPRAPEEVRPRPQAGRPSRLTAPLADRRGPLSIRGCVLGPGGPVAQASVIATGAGGEDLSTLDSGCRRDEALLDGTCPEASRRLAALAEQHPGAAPAIARALSSADGTFELAGLPPGPLTLWAESAGRGIALLRGVEAGATGVELRLRPGHLLAGRVLGDSGEPLPGATVAALSAEHRQYFYGESGNDGRFLIGPVPWAEYTLVATAEGRLPAHARADEARPPTLRLFTPLRLAGRVVRDGHPVPGATVETQEVDGVDKVTCDANGRFELAPVSPGLHVLSAAAGLDHGIASVQLAPGRSREDVELRLTEGAELSGGVFDEGDGPVAGALLVLQGDEGLREVRTAPDGSYRLGPLVPGEHSLEVRAEGFPEVRLGRFPLAPGQRLTLDVRLRAGLTLSGVVVDPNGAPVRDAELELWKPNCCVLPPTHVGATVTGEGGRFAFKGLEPTRYELSVHHPRFSALRQDIEVPGPEERLVLERGGAIEGQVVDGRDRPVPGIRVTAVSDRDAFSAMEDAHRQVTTDDDGRFTLDALGAGSYRVVATWQVRGGRTTSARTDVATGAVTRILLRFADDRPLVGRVVDPAGAPLEGVRVEVAAEDGAPLPNDDPAGAMTDAEGHFEFHDLPPGRYQVYVPIYHDDPHPPAGVAEPGGPPITLVLTPKPRLYGRVVDEARRPFTVFWIDHTRYSAPDGAFALDAPTWPQSYAISAPGAATRHVLLGSDSTREAPQEVVLPPGHRIDGTVIDASTGAPVVNAEVSLSANGGPFSGDAPDAVTHTGLEGAFALGDIAAGDTLRVNKPGYAAEKLRLGDERTVGPIRLAPRTGIFGVVGSSGAPQLGQLEVTAEGPGFALTLPKPDHTYELTGLAPGDYVVTLAEASAGGLSPLASARVTVPPAGRVRADLLPDGHAATVRVRLEAAAACGRMALVPSPVEVPRTAEELAVLLASLPLGAVVHSGAPSCQPAFPSVPAGQYTLVAELLPAGLRPWVFSRELEVPPGGTPTFDFILSDGAPPGR